MQMVKHLSSHYPTKYSIMLISLQTTTDVQQGFHFGLSEKYKWMMTTDLFVAFNIYVFFGTWQVPVA